MITDESASEVDDGGSAKKDPLDKVVIKASDDITARRTAGARDAEREMKDPLRGVFQDAWRAVRSSESMGELPERLFEALRHSAALQFYQEAGQLLAEEEVDATQRDRSTTIGRDIEPKSPEGGKAAAGELAGASSPEGRPEQVSDIPGSSSEVRLQVRAAMRRLRGDLDGSIRFLATLLPPTIERLESEGTSQVAITDVATTALGSVAEQAPQIMSRLLPRLWTYLLGAKESTGDWYLTVVGVGNLLVGLRGQERMNALVLYEAVLDDVRGRWQRVHPDPTSVEHEELRAVELAANNYAARMAGLLQDQDREATDASSDALARLVRVSISMEVYALPSASPEELTQIGTVPPFNALKSVELTELQLLEMLDSMTNVSSAIPLESGSLELAYLEALGAVGRVALRRAHRVAAGFFNAGVTLIRGREGRRVNERVRLRVFLNALGLWWSLRFSTGRAAEALVELDGLDCAVNLFGAVADFPVHGGRVVRSAMALARSLAEFRRSRPDVGDSSSWERLVGSWERLRFSLESADASAEAESNIMSQVELVLIELRKEMQLPERSVGMPDEVLAAHDVRDAFEIGYYRNEVEAISRVRREVEAVIQRFASQARHPVETLLNEYGPLADRGGAVVAAGLQSAEEWSGRKAALEVERTSLAEVFRQLTV